MVFFLLFSFTGSEVFRVQVYPRFEFKLEPVDNSLSDINYFKVEGLDNQTVAIKVARSLEDLVDKVSIKYFLILETSSFRTSLIFCTTKQLD